MQNEFYRTRIKECKEAKTALVVQINEMPEGSERTKKENELRRVKTELENWLNAG